MKVLLDTNIVLDAIAEREPFKNAAQQILLMAANDEIDAYLTANSLTDIYYVLRRHITDDTAREALRVIIDAFSVIDLLASDCEAALDIPIKDYEDAVAVACAKKTKVDCIVTRYEAFLKESTKLPMFAPSDFINEACRS